VTKADLFVERGARRLQELADKAAARGDGVGTWLSEELRTDAAFLRKLKPSLVKARAKGERPAAQAQEPAAAPPPPPPPPRPASSKPRKKKKARSGGPPPVVIVGAAFVAGIVLAKVVDWRGHAHPRD
jgi:hypothetical protein